MSIGSLGMLGSIATSPLAQSKGSEIDRTKSEVANRAREAEAERLSEVASGVGETGEEKEAGDRDADGRRFWETPLDGQRSTMGESASANASILQSKDASGQSGRNVDLSG